MMDLTAGEQLDHYMLDRMVARSGMATLFQAHDLRTGRTVAIKVPHPEVESDPALFERFQREQRIGLALEHPGVVKVLPNEDHSRVYLAMEWVEGKLLRQLLQQRIAPERAIAIAIALCDALQYIHAHGVVHRDLKPENIMVGEDDSIKLIDFGIAANAGSRRLTFANFSTALGTPDYVAPEQVKGKRGDARTDLYSLGVILYEMLTGKVPFTGENPFTVMNDRLLNNPISPRQVNPALSPEVEEVLLRALERDPINRYQAARELGQDLRHPEGVVLTPRPVYSTQRRSAAPLRRALLLYIGLGSIPLLIFALLLYTAKHR